MGFRVQAKRLYGDGRYRGLWKGQPTDPAGARQTAKLLGESAFDTWRYQTAPYYAFYNWWPAPAGAERAQLRHALRGRCRDLRRAGPRHGWTMAHVRAVAERLEQGRAASVRGAAAGNPTEPATHLHDHLPAAHSLRCFVARAAALARWIAAARAKAAVTLPRWAAPLTMRWADEKSEFWPAPPVLLGADGAGGDWPVYRAPPLYATAALRTVTANGFQALASAGAGRDRDALAQRLTRDAQADLRDGVAPEIGVEVPEAVAGVALVVLDGGGA